MERFKGKKKQIILGHLVALLILMSYILPDVLMVAKNVTTIKAADMKKNAAKVHIDYDIDFPNSNGYEFDRAEESFKIINLQTTGKLKGIDFEAKSSDSNVVKVVELHIDDNGSWIALDLLDEGSSFITIYAYDHVNDRATVCTKNIRVTDSNKKEETSTSKEVKSSFLTIDKKEQVVSVDREIFIHFSCSTSEVWYSIIGDNSKIKVKSQQYNGEKKYIIVRGLKVGKVKLQLQCAGASDTVEIEVVPYSQGESQQSSSQSQAEQTTVIETRTETVENAPIYLKPDENNFIDLGQTLYKCCAWSDNLDVVDNVWWDGNYSEIGIHTKSDIKYNTWTDVEFYGDILNGNKNGNYRIIVQAEPIIRKETDIHMYVGEELTLMENGDKSSYSISDNTAGAVSYEIEDNDCHPIKIKAKKAGKGSFKIYDYGNSKWGYGNTKEYNITVTEKPKITYSSNNTIKIKKGETAKAVFKPSNYNASKTVYDLGNATIASTSSDKLVKDSNGNVTGLEIQGNKAGKTTIKATIKDDWGQKAEVTWNVEVYDPLEVEIIPYDLVEDSEGKYWANSDQSTFVVKFNQKVDNFTKSSIVFGNSKNTVESVTKLNYSSKGDMYKVVINNKYDFRKNESIILIPGLTHIAGTNITYDSIVFNYNIDKTKPKVTTIKPSVNPDSNEIIVEFTIKDNNAMETVKKQTLRYTKPKTIIAEIRDLIFSIGSENATDVNLEKIEGAEGTLNYRATIKVNDLASKKQEMLKFQLHPIFEDSITDIAGNYVEQIEKSYMISDLFDEYQEKQNKIREYEYEDQEDEDKVKPYLNLKSFSKKYIKENGKIYVVFTSQLEITDNNALNTKSNGLSYNNNINAYKNRTTEHAPLDASSTTIKEAINERFVRGYFVTSKIEVGTEKFDDWTYDLQIQGDGGASPGRIRSGQSHL